MKNLTSSVNARRLGQLGVDACLLALAYYLAYVLRFDAGIEDLAAALRAHADGLYCAQAAAELLIGHRVWLGRAEFVDRVAGPP